MLLRAGRLEPSFFSVIWHPPVNHMRVQELNYISEMEKLHVYTHSSIIASHLVKIIRITSKVSRTVIWNFLCTYTANRNLSMNWTSMSEIVPSVVCTLNCPYMLFNYTGNFFLNDFYYLDICECNNPIR